MSANKQKNKECFSSDIPQRTLSAFQMGSRPSDRILFHNCTNHPARIADSHRVVRNIFNNNTAAANHNIASDRNPRHDMNARSDPNIAAHRDGIRIFQSLVAPLGINGVSCRVEAAVRCNKHIVTEGDLPAIQNHRVVICEEVFTDLNVIAVPPHHGSALYKRFLGYKKGADGEPEIVPSEAAIVERIFNLYLAGETVDNISKMMQAENYDIPGKTISFSKGMIMNMLSNERYCGEAPMYYVQNNHPAIIDRVTFNKVQEELARRKTKTPGSAKSSITSTGKYSRYALTDVLICGNCGTRYRRVTWSRNGTKRIVWRCISRLDYGKKYCHSSPTLDEAPLQQAIIAALNTVLPDLDGRIRQITEALEAEVIPFPGSGMSLGDIDRRLAELEMQFQRLLEKAADDPIAYGDQFKEILDEQTALKELRASILAESKEHAEADRRIRDAAGMLENAVPHIAEWDESAIRQLVAQVKVLSKNEISVTLKSGIEIRQSISN